MNNSLEEILETPIYSSKKITIKALDIFIFIIISCLLILARLTLFDIQSRDFEVFLSKWFAEIKALGGISALAHNIGDYTPPYLYIMTFLTYLPIDPLISIKVVSCLCDFILAFFVMKIVFEKSNNYFYSILAYSLVLACPTVLLNSAAWAQCDVIFTLFLVLCLSAFLKKRPLLGSVFFAISFCFKLQAIFLFPFLVIMWIKGQMKFRHFFAIPIVYLVSILPAFFVGRPFFELLAIYFSQAGQYSSLSMNAANPYLLLEKTTVTGISGMAVMIALLILILLFYYIYQKKFLLNNSLILKFSLFSAIIMPYILPHMHERYFYTADVISIIYAFYNPKKWYLSALVIFSSTICYLPYLFGVTPINTIFTVFTMSLALLLLVFDIKKEMEA